MPQTRPGLLAGAVKTSGIGARETLLVGDDVRDVEAALAAGIAPVLVRTGKGALAEHSCTNAASCLPYSMICCTSRAS